MESAKFPGGNASSSSPLNAILAPNSILEISRAASVVGERTIVQGRAKERNGISTNLVFISNNNDKNSLGNQMEDCFPNLPVHSYIDDLEFMARQHHQRIWLADDDKATLLEPNMELLEDGLDFLLQQYTKNSRNTSLFMLFRSWNCTFP
jgi:hypothetical protein